MTGAGAGWWLTADRQWRKGTPPDDWMQGSDGRWYPPSAVDDLALPPPSPPNGWPAAADEPTVAAELPATAWDRRQAAADEPTMAVDLPVTPPEGTMAGRSVFTPAAGGRRVGPGLDTEPTPSLGAEYFAAPWTRIAVVAVTVIVALTAAAVVTLASGNDTPPDDDEVAASTTTVVPPAVQGPSSASPPPSPDDTVTTETSPSTTSGTSTTAPTSTTRPDRSPSTTAASTTDDPLARCSPGQRSVIQRGSHDWSWYVDRYDPDGNGILCE